MALVNGNQILKDNGFDAAAAARYTAVEHAQIGTTFERWIAGNRDVFFDPIKGYFKAPRQLTKKLVVV